MKKRYLFTISALMAMLLCSCTLIYDQESSDISSEVSDTSSENSSTFTSTDLNFESDPEKSDSIGGIVIPTEFNNDDLFLHNVLTQKADSAVECALAYFSGYVDDPLELIDFFFEGKADPMHYYKIADRFPQTVEDMEKQLKKYFTSEVTTRYMRNVSKGTIAENTDGTFAVEIAGDSAPTRFIEIDGKMYCFEAFAGNGLTDSYRNTAKVTSRMDDTITFTYIYAYYGELTEGEGILKKEDSDWKFARCECWLMD